MKLSELIKKDIVNIHDVAFNDSTKYIVMEFLEGITLKEYLKEKGKLHFNEAIIYIEQILSALEHAHTLEIVHRDIKPQNIILGSDKRITVTDFGIAKLPNSDTITLTDKAMGTVFYISPEQASGEPTDFRTDIYSVGIMLYEMVTGKLVKDQVNGYFILPVLCMAFSFLSQWLMQRMQKEQQQLQTDRLA